MNPFQEPKIDCHCHILDPKNFPYAAEVSYRPQGQETGDKHYFAQVMQTYGVTHALLVGPNSGYGLDNRCLLDAIASYPKLYKGIAVVPNDASAVSLAQLKAQGIVGVAFNASLLGVAHYNSIGPLLQRLEQLGMWAQFQVEGDQLTQLFPMIDESGVRVLIDHCGRPTVSEGVSQRGFQTLLAMGKAGRAVVKISGFSKFSAQLYPFADTQVFVNALLTHFGPNNCIWASDWPYLKASARLDYGPMLALGLTQMSRAERHQVLWETPARLFEFG
jgi:predicted TIM-barrel fold metal-dependent hydrolase